jgi:hypothetical protein
MGSGTPGVTGTHGRPAPVAGPLSRRTRVWLSATAALLIVGIAGVAVWATVDPGRYSSSGDGCVALTVANSTGGTVLHACGAQARTMCASAFANVDRIALMTRPQCILAGLGTAAP